MLSAQFKQRVRVLVGRFVARTVGRTRLSANMLSFVGLLLNIGACALLARGALGWGGCAVALAAAFDLLDGALARTKQQASRFGAFLDSTLDRYTEALLFLGLLLHYQRVGAAAHDLTLVYAAIIGSLMVSYVRARAEALGFSGAVGLLERPERIVLLVLGLLTGWLTAALWALAVLTHLTAMQRIFSVWHQYRAASGTRAAPRRNEQDTPVSHPDALNL